MGRIYWNGKDILEWEGDIGMGMRYRNRNEILERE